MEVILDVARCSRSKNSRGRVPLLALEPSTSQG